MISIGYIGDSCKLRAREPGSRVEIKEIDTACHGVSAYLHCYYEMQKGHDNIEKYLRQ